MRPTVSLWRRQESGSGDDPPHFMPDGVAVGVVAVLEPVEVNHPGSQR
jgi:hypothetical protein